MFFSVPGTPVAKGRPRFARGAGGFVRTYTPEATVRFEERIRLEALAAGIIPLGGPVRVTILAVWPMKGAPRKRNPRPGGWKDTRPDVENVAKAVLDALNGIAYADDAQVAELVARKGHAEQGGVARTEIEIEALGGSDGAAEGGPG